LRLVLDTLRNNKYLCEAKEMKKLLGLGWLLWLLPEVLKDFILPPMK
jgi:hypothetical protein